jgi:predicted AlkP superfamily phosphohydrolase/phosphomutase
MLGLDAALPDLIRRFAEEGNLPNIARLMSRGVFARIITTFPPLTAAAWAAITSGAGPGTAGIPSLMVHLPGESLDKWHTSFDRRMLKAETLWETGARVNKRTLLVNWPVTWPLGIENGVQIGASLNPPFRYFYMPLWDIAGSSLFATESYRCNQVSGRAVVVTPAPATGWSGLPNSSSTALEVQIDVPPTYATGTRYHVAIVDSAGKGYDRVLICRGRDAASPLATLRQGERSAWITESFGTPDGSHRGRFYFHLLWLDGSPRLKLYASAINTAENFCVPPEITADITKAAGPYMEVDDPWAYMDGWASIDFYLDQLTAHGEWWAKATRYALTSHAWDLAFSWMGTIDHAQHVLYGGIDRRSQHFGEKEYPAILGYLRRVYQEADIGIGRILEAVNLDETLVCCVSDHGFSALERSPYLKFHLAQAGLLSFTLDDRGEMVVDWSKTKAFPLEPCHAHIFVNLKGRDPEGIVDPGDYRKVQEEIIDALLAMRDPHTGERVVALAVRKEEAGTLGVFPRQGFDRVGDVLFALKPSYMANPFVYPVDVRYRDGTARRIANPEAFEPAVLHRTFTGAHLALPAIPEMHAALVLAGPGVRHLDRRQPVNIVDIAPTLAHVLGMPVPAHAEGNILHDVPEGLL